MSAGAITERQVVFDCAGSSCLGVLAQPQEAARIGVLVVVGGPQTRVGSHRQFVHLARALARAGVPVLRFDYRGMGDSDGERRTFEDIAADMAAAIDALVREARVDGVVLWGLCDAASAALMHAADDARVRGVVAVNPWARTPEVEASARLRHYYAQRLLAPAFWSKLVRGKLDVRDAAQGVSSAVQSARRAPTADFLARMDAGWTRFAGPLLFVLSGLDHTAREFESWVAADAARTQRLHDARTSVVHVAEADHTFASQALRERLAQATLAWLRALG